jgi:ribosomal protein S7
MKRYNSLNFFFGKFLNHLMFSGKKTKAEKLLSTIFYFLVKKKKSPLLIFLSVIINTVTTVELKTIRRGSRVSEVPRPISYSRAISKTYKVLIKEALTLPGSLCSNITSLLLDYSNNKGKLIALKKKTEIKAEKLRALNHYRW